MLLQIDARRDVDLILICREHYTFCGDATQINLVAVPRHAATAMEGSSGYRAHSAYPAPWLEWPNFQLSTLNEGLPVISRIINVVVFVIYFSPCLHFLRL